MYMHFYKTDIYIGIGFIIFSLIIILFRSYYVRFQIRSFGRSFLAVLFKWTPEKEQHIGEILVSWSNTYHYGHPILFRAFKIGFKLVYKL
jgi:hypothetical protein